MSLGAAAPAVCQRVQGEAREYAQRRGAAHPQRLYRLVHLLRRFESYVFYLVGQQSLIQNYNASLIRGKADVIDCLKVFHL
jgi:hypothetical protein